MVPLHRRRTIRLQPIPPPGLQHFLVPHARRRRRRSRRHAPVDQATVPGRRAGRARRRRGRPDGGREGVRDRRRGVDHGRSRHGSEVTEDGVEERVADVAIHR